MMDVYESTPGTVVLNHGDPLFARALNRPDDIQLAREVFLRIVAYVPFAQTICIPSRYILDGTAMYQATLWAGPLLEAGIVQPERRAEIPSFVELADDRRLGATGRARAQELDRLATTARPVRWKPLEATWRELIIGDLQPDGPFRSLLARRGLGAKRGRNAAALNTVAARYAAEGQGLEDFLALVGQYCPGSVQRYAVRWAMARYYHTPTLMDATSVREIPEYAGKLLLSTGALPDLSEPIDAATPAAQAHGRLSIEVPLFGNIGERTHVFCRVAMRVRDEVPEARRVFTERIDQRSLSENGLTVSQALEEEARRQLKPRGRFHPWGARLGIGLFSGGVGLGLGVLDPYLGGASGFGAAAGAEKVRDYIERQRRSWEVAIDRLTEYARRP
jgi:hypothetical protein